MSVILNDEDLRREEEIIMSTCATIFKAGDRVKVIANTAGHNIPLGSVGTIRQPNGTCWLLNEYQLNFAHCDLVRTEWSKCELKKEIAELEEKASELKNKLTFLEETGVEKFCCKQFKAYQTLKFLEDGNLTLLQKATKIAELFN